MEEGSLRLSLVVMVCKLGLFSIYLFIYIVEPPARSSKQKPGRHLRWHYFFSLKKAAVIPKLVLKALKVSGRLTFSPHWKPKLGPNISEGCGRASNKVDELANKKEGKSGKWLKIKNNKTNKLRTIKTEGPLTFRIDHPTSNNQIGKIPRRTTQRPYLLVESRFNQPPHIASHTLWASRDADLTGIENAGVHSRQGQERTG